MGPTVETRRACRFVFGSAAQKALVGLGLSSDAGPLGSACPAQAWLISVGVRLISAGVGLQCRCQIPVSASQTASDGSIVGVRCGGKISRHGRLELPSVHLQTGSGRDLTARAALMLMRADSARDLPT